MTTSTFASVVNSVQPSSTNANGINNTLFHRLAVISTVKCFRRFFPRHGSVLFLTKKLCVKYGDLAQIAEAFTMQFIASNTSIPVPKVYCAFVHKGCTYIVMERIYGQTLARGWHSRSADSKESILSICQSPNGPFGLSHATAGPPPRLSSLLRFFNTPSPPHIDVEPCLGVSQGSQGPAGSVIHAGQALLHVAME
ncbi:hypothetical protein J3R83DRAFT_4388 [Lanmaoa asiatica]|nr:hypothetical protein J3R83DRAFT_4388 [Lanmaoa asiatica]